MLTGVDALPGEGPDGDGVQIMVEEGLNHGGCIQGVDIDCLGRAALFARSLLPGSALICETSDDLITWNAQTILDD